MKDKKYVLFVNGGASGVDWYRIMQPCLKLMERENYICSPSNSMNETDLEFWIDKCDIMVTHKTSEKFYQFMKENKGKKKFVIDEDDDVFSISPFNPGYQHFGVKEVNYQLSDGKIIKLRDGENGFNIEENKRRLHFYVKCLQLADAVTTTSSVLCGMLRRFNKNVHIVRNYLNFKVWNPIEMSKDDSIRIGYQCGWSHMEDWFEVRDVLLRIMKENEKVKLVIFGQSYDGSLQEFPQDRIERHGWVNMEAYPWKLKCLNFDVSICPLYNCDFSTAKSEIKWEEASSLGVPSICQNIPPYNLVVKDGETGYLCGDSKDWYEALSILIGSKDLRDKIGMQAKMYVNEHYDIDREVVKYEDLFKTLTPKQELILV